LWFITLASAAAPTTITTIWNAKAHSTQ
jgi:hypothetical protein